MKKTLFLLALIVAGKTVISQVSYWQQEAHYSIDVALDAHRHTLKGRLSLQYVNHSPDTLRFIWFHLWPNAYKNDETALARQMMTSKEGRKDINKKEKGYIDSLAFVVNGQKAETANDPLGNIDVVKLLLPQPILPGATTKIETPFFVRLPEYHSRSGYEGDQYMICQWYPKPAVYDRKGWHAFPYLDQGEFYSEYGSFTVNITVPAEYVVGATGTLLTADELATYKRIGQQNYKTPKKVTKYQTDQPGKLKTLSWFGENIHDFAWFADKDVVIQYDTLQMKSGKIIDVFSWYQPDGNKQWRSSIGYIEDAVKQYSSWVGEYPWPVVQAVEGPPNSFSGGMEYPMITLITSPHAGEKRLDDVITHEVGHNWFYGILGSNERDHPFMDEGINSFYEFRYMAEKYHTNLLFGKSLPKALKNLPPDAMLDRVYNALDIIAPRAAVNTTSTGFANKDDYGFVVYMKAAAWLNIVQEALGREIFDKAMHGYFETWKFKHPYPEDMKTALEKASGINLDAQFALLNREGSLQQ